ncbi:hypothetical protein [Chitinophaga pinensis]|uniref:Uncharacterized protein n=1 Tax=Chitinophaga pinensis (strain ATCC 43595 / DSM 2588 / LMG 13176 / NBRC 15968 / NCIMB 11800 / UQM 2034) TaxID=485918 RepID=A0A979G6C7_CHIPD|nr:hypothetical protein [Chitinophaga pinensis]ACU61679.1 hypothetical protein Cpin_4223 [Chitinophaga pinensis DSM 2588]
MKRHLVLYFMLIVGFSCNRVMFVEKKDLINSHKGYLIFYYESEEALFFPSKDSVDSEFLSKSHKDGYRIASSENDLVYLRKLAVSQAIVKNILQNGRSIQVPDSVKLIPVKVKYYWGEKSALKLQKAIDGSNSIRFEYSNKEIKLSYRIYDYRRVMSIDLIRRSDIEKSARLYVPSGQHEN